MNCLCSVTRNKVASQDSFIIACLVLARNCASAAPVNVWISYLLSLHAVGPLQHIIDYPTNQDCPCKVVSFSVQREYGSLLRFRAGQLKMWQ